MRLPFKLLPCIFLTGIVSVFGLDAQTGFISSYLPSNSFFSNIFNFSESPTTKKQLPNKKNQHNKSTNRSLGEDASNTNSLSTNKFFVDALPANPGVTRSIRTAGIDGTGGPSGDVAGIDGTGGPSEDVAGIDGTGGPSGDVAGIDGTGGPSSEDITGIDGTGGPKSEGPHTIAKVTLATIGTVQQQGNRLVINGINFRTTDKTQIVIDGNTGTDASALNSGQVVMIRGSVDENNNGIAERVIYTTQVSGTITNIKSTEKSITVLGQTIILHDEIIFGGTATQFSDLQVGDTVNVSGFRLSNGDLSATRIDRVDSTKDKVTGTISGLNETDRTFVVNALTVNYSGVTTLPILNNGVIVNIQGTIDSEDASTLNADSIEVTTSITDNDVERVEVEGFITEFTDPSDFKVGNTAIFTDLQTEFIGNGRNDLGLNVKIEVEGYLDNNNKLIAKRVLFLVANITSHGYRSKVSGSTDTFRWNNVNAKAYRLRIFQVANGVFYDETFDGDITSATIDGLPENSAFFYLELYTLQGEFWSRKRYNFFGSGTVTDAILTSHEQGDVLESTTETFTWNTVPNAEAYRIRIFDYHTDTDIDDDFPETLFNSPETVTLSNLPINGADIHVRLSTLHNGWWSSNFYNLKSVKILKNATLISHTNGQQLNSDTETFTWENVGADQYEVRLARRMINGWFDIIDTVLVDGSDTSLTIEDLPLNSAEVYIRLRTQHCVWVEADEENSCDWATEYYTFTGAGTIPNTTLTSHTNRSVLSSTTETFTWDKNLEVEEYHLTILSPLIDGSPKFSDDYDNNGDATTISQEVSNLSRNGSETIVQLSIKHNGYWSHQRYQLYGMSELSNAELTSHTDGQQVDTPSMTITWNDVDAEGYYVTILNTSVPGHPRIHHQPYDSDTHSAVIENLPENAQLLIGISTKHGDWWGGKLLSIFTK